MPLPNPKKGEDKSSFVSRCIAFVKRENSKIPNDQASAMCYSKWDSSKKETKSSDDADFIVRTLLDA